MAKENGILQLNPELYREIDGVVFDLDGYARHCDTPPQPSFFDRLPTGEQTADTAHDTTACTEAGAEQTDAPSPAHEDRAEHMPVFAVPPTPQGWYPATETTPPVPMMAGALVPNAYEVSFENGQAVYWYTVWQGTGSHASSFMNSYRTSYHTSYRTSYYTSYHGSYYASFLFSSAVTSYGNALGDTSGLWAAGYGLELI